LALIVFGGVVLEASTNFLKGDGMQWIFDEEVIAEETMELLGAMLMVYAFAVWHENFNEQEYLAKNESNFVINSVQVKPDPI
jgi:hypothetical protein